VQKGKDNIKGDDNNYPNAKNLFINNFFFMNTVKCLFVFFFAVALIVLINISTYEKLCDMNYEFPQARAWAEVSTFICEKSTSWEIRDREMMNSFAKLGL